MDIRNFIKWTEVSVNIQNFTKCIEISLIIGIVRTGTSLTIRNTV